MSTSSETEQRTRRLVAVTVALTFALAACAGDPGETPAVAGNAAKWDQKSAESEYRLIRAEIRLAESEKPYLVLNLAALKVQLRLKGVVVWEYPLELIGTDKSELRNFSSDFMGDKETMVRPVLEQYLFAAQEQTPDSVLAIISEATKFEKSLLQRELPSRFQLRWAGGLVLDIRTDVEGKETSSFKNRLRELQQAIARPFGHEIITCRMPKENALTLYRTARPGVPTLLIPA